MSRPLHSPASPEHDPVFLAEEDARRVVLVRAVEEADLEGVLVGPDVREEASLLARRGGEGQGASLLAARASDLSQRLGEAHPVLARFGRLQFPGMVWIVALAILVGLLSNLFGAERQIHVLANPLVLLVLWNLLVLAGLGIARILAMLRTGRSQAPGETRHSNLTRHLVALPMKGLRRAIEASEGKSHAVPLTRAAARFFEDWLRVSAPLNAARLHRCLHAGAIGLTLGALLGMYARGLVLEYRAHWESTFLDQESAQALLDVGLAPASILGSIEVPRLAEIEGSTRAFLHLFSITALLFVVIPRSILVLLATRHGRELARNLPLDTGPLYYRRLLASSRGRGVGIDVHPYSFSLSKERVHAVESLLHDVFGGEALVKVHGALAYGAESEDLMLDGRELAQGPLVILFNLAQTPERELQGALLDGLRPVASAGLVVLADCSAWRERVGSGPTFAERLVEHRKAWERLAKEVGVPIVHVDLEAEPEEALLAQIEAALEGRVLSPQPQSATL